jgi:hypothetical protein
MGTKNQNPERNKEMKTATLNPDYTLTKALQFWPYAPTNRTHWGRVPWSAAAQHFGMGDMGFVGHDGKWFYFQNRGDNTQYKVSIDSRNRQFEAVPMFQA